MAAGGIEISVEQTDLTRIALRLKELEGDAHNTNRLRASLIRNLRTAVAPAVSEVKSGAAAISHGGGSGRPWGGDTSSLGAAIAAGIGTQVRLTGPRVGVKVRAAKKGMPRGFKNAPNRMNRPDFQHPVFGRRTWVTQVGNPQFFDGPLKRDKAAYRAACVAAMEEIARALATK